MTAAREANSTETPLKPISFNIVVVTMATYELSMAVSKYVFPDGVTGCLEAYDLKVAITPLEQIVLDYCFRAQVTIGMSRLTDLDRFPTVFPHRRHALKQIMIDAIRFGWTVPQRVVINDDTNRAELRVDESAMVDSVVARCVPKPDHSLRAIPRMLEATACQSASDRSIELNRAFFGVGGTAITES